MVHRTIKAELPPDHQKPKTNEIFTRPGLLGRSTSDQGSKANTSRSPVLTQVAKRRKTQLTNFALIQRTFSLLARRKRNNPKVMRLMVIQKKTSME
ncbi:unnamed protein product [Porites evermanni]|uniref:Uncharacterized protein n=1 Tax=Porites evermanni TaxID=104178 RepID=A0ABN8LKG0_9CNID|nr:unnamed protein product [Porites evermanni]